MISLAGSDIWLTWLLPAGGQPLDGGGVGVDSFWITALGTEVACVVPSLFVARTRKRTVLPTSADFSVYCCVFAPPMLAQLPPSLSQRSHWYWYLSGLLSQLPRLPWSCLPCCGVPEIVGGEVFTGLAVPAATLEPAQAASEATTTAATPAPKAAPMAVQRFLCVVCMSYPFRLLVLSETRYPHTAGAKRRFSRRLHLPRLGLTCAHGP